MKIFVFFLLFLFSHFTCASDLHIQNENIVNFTNIYASIVGESTEDVVHVMSGEEVLRATDSYARNKRCTCISATVGNNCLVLYFVSWHESETITSLMVRDISKDHILQALKQSGFRVTSGKKNRLNFWTVVRK